MGRSLSEWIDSYEAAQHFETQIETHIEVMADLWEDEQSALVRLIMISFRDAALDFGAEP